MSFNVQFGVVSKKHNSTEQGLHNVTLVCNLKEPSSVTNPSLFVDISEHDLFSGGTLNHCYIAEFDRYYYVDNWTFERGHWRADLSVDVLATWKTEIGNSSQYILRCSADSDGRIYDSLYPTVNDIYEYVTGANGAIWDLTNGAYVVGVISDDYAGFGAVTYYIMSDSDMRTLSEYLLGTGYINQSEILQDMSLETWKSLYNPFQYIASCMYIPVNMSWFRGSYKSVRVGYWQIVSGGRAIWAFLLGATDGNFSVTIPLPSNDHPKIARGSYLHCNPYTTMDFDFAPFGHIQIPADIVYARGDLDVDVVVDFISGKATCYVGGSYNPIAVMEAKVGIPIQLAQMNTDYLGMAATAVSSLAGVAGSTLSGDVAGAISNAATGIDSAARSMVPRLNTVGGNGGFSAVRYDRPYLTTRFYDTTDEDNSHLGRPLCETRQISTIPGYIMTNQAAVDTNGTETENLMITSTMDKGFYYE